MRTNLCRTEPVSITAYAAAEGDNPAKAIDGDLITYWQETDSPSGCQLRLEWGSLATFDKVWVYDANLSTYTDRTTEAASAEGTAFLVFDATNDYLYLGALTPFSGVKVALDVAGVADDPKFPCVLDAEFYHTTTGWTPLPYVSDGTYKNSETFSQDGVVSWMVPNGWKSDHFVNGYPAYWIRLSVDELWTTKPTVYQLLPLVDSDYTYRAKRVQLRLVDGWTDLSSSISIAAGVGTGLPMSVPKSLTWNDKKTIATITATADDFEFDRLWVYFYPIGDDLQRVKVKELAVYGIESAAVRSTDTVDVLTSKIDGYPDNVSWRSLITLYKGHDDTVGEDGDIAYGKTVNGDSEFDGFFDYVVEWDNSKSAFSDDHTREAATYAGTEFEIVHQAADFCYLGSDLEFEGAKIRLKTAGVGGGIFDGSYWDGAGWVCLAGWTDTTNSLTQDGEVLWDIPDDWATTTVNGQGPYYFVRLYVGTNYTTAPKAYMIWPLGMNEFSYSDAVDGDSDTYWLSEPFWMSPAIPPHYESEDKYPAGGGPFLQVDLGAIYDLEMIAYRSVVVRQKGAPFEYQLEELSTSQYGEPRWRVYGSANSTQWNEITEHLGRCGRDSDGFDYGSVKIGHGADPKVSARYLCFVLVGLTIASTETPYWVGLSRVVVRTWAPETHGAVTTGGEEIEADYADVLSIGPVGARIEVEGTQAQTHKTNIVLMNNVGRLSPNNSASPFYRKSYTDWPVKIETYLVDGDGDYIADTRTEVGWGVITRINETHERGPTVRLELQDFRWTIHQHALRANGVLAWDTEDLHLVSTIVHSSGATITMTEAPWVNPGVCECQRWTITFTGTSTFEVESSASGVKKSGSTGSNFWSGPADDPAKSELAIFGGSWSGTATEGDTITFYTTYSANNVPIGDFLYYLLSTVHGANLTNHAIDGDWGVFPFINAQYNGEDNTIVEGADFPVFGQTTDYIYVWNRHRYDGITVALDTAGTGGTVGTPITLTVEYLNELNIWTAVSGLSDGTYTGYTTLAQDGDVTWTIPSDWTYNNYHYLIRLSISAAYTRTPIVEKFRVHGPYRRFRPSFAYLNDRYPNASCRGARLSSKTVFSEVALRGRDVMAHLFQTPDGKATAIDLWPLYDDLNGYRRFLKNRDVESVSAQEWKKIQAFRIRHDFDWEGGGTQKMVTIPTGGKPMSLDEHEALFTPGDSGAVGHATTIAGRSYSYRSAHMRELSVDLLPHCDGVRVGDTVFIESQSPPTYGTDPTDPDGTQLSGVVCLVTDVSMRPVQSRGADVSCVPSVEIKALDREFVVRSYYIIDVDEIPDGTSDAKPIW
jgi:hypothetical protein